MQCRDAAILRLPRAEPARDGFNTLETALLNRSVVRRGFRCGSVLHLLWAIRTPPIQRLFGNCISSCYV